MSVEELNMIGDLLEKFLNHISLTESERNSIIKIVFLADLMLETKKHIITV
jgi:hypothetical protein